VVIFLQADVGWNSDLTTALRVLLSDRPLREQLGRNGRQTVLQGYTLAHQARQLLTIYRECLV
jgi:glycosyltransferase involved in cell wall biosynthesis